MDQPTFNLQAQRIMVSQVGDIFVVFIYKPKETFTLVQMENCKVPFEMDLKDETGEWFGGNSWKVVSLVGNWDDTRARVLQLKRV